MAKINCPKCIGTGLTGSSNLATCSECSGTGVITVDDTQTLSTINNASQVPLEETGAGAPSVAVDQVEINQQIIG